MFEEFFLAKKIREKRDRILREKKITDKKTHFYISVTREICWLVKVDIKLIT